MTSRIDIVAGAEWRSRRSVAIVGLVGVVLVFVGIAAMFSFQQPPFYDADEKAHLGYAHEIADFRLPEIGSQPDVPVSAIQWRAELATGHDDRYRGVWVANHPPLHYVAVVPLVWVAELTDRPDGGLLLLRLVNIAFAAIGVVFTYLLATELSGGVRRTGVAAAAIVALVPQGHTYFSRGLNDGLALAAGTGLIWAALRCLRRRDERRDLVLLGAMAAVAAGARTVTMLLAVAVVSAVVLNRLTLAGTESWRDRLCGAAVTAATGLGPAVALFGWFYVRMQVLYGDIGASTYLLDYFGRASQGSIAGVMTRGQLWVDVYQRMASTAPLSWARPRFATVVAGIALAGLVGVVARGHPVVSRRALAVCGVSVAVITLTFAQHVAGGGNSYPRYFFPVLGVLGALVAVAFDQLVPRLLPAMLVTAMAWWAIGQTPVGIDPAATLRPRDNGHMPPSVLRALPVGDQWRAAAAGLIGGGALLLAIALGLGLAQFRSGRAAECDRSDDEHVRPWPESGRNSIATGEFQSPDQ